LYYKYYFFIIIKSINVKISIICFTNIIIFIIIKCINIKNSIICVINIIIITIIKSIRKKNSIICDINIIIFTIINSINIKNSIICVINTIERAFLLLFFFCQELWLGIAYYAKSYWAGLVAGVNVVRSCCQATSKTLLKRVTSVRFCCPA